MATILNIIHRPDEGEPDTLLDIVNTVDSLSYLVRALEMMSAGLSGEDRSALALVAGVLGEGLEEVSERITAIHRAPRMEGSG